VVDKKVGEEEQKDTYLDKIREGNPDEAQQSKDETEKKQAEKRSEAIQSDDSKPEESK
jgi:hypothetical protein